METYLYLLEDFIELAKSKTAKNPRISFLNEPCESYIGNKKAAGEKISTTDR
tara:strand:- start:6 stop:161 length:156 start_codon:yes stop_codon:yes gene_type:complete